VRQFPKLAPHKESKLAIKNLKEPRPNLFKKSGQQTINQERKLTDLRNQRDASNQEIWTMVKRIRSGIKSFFGDDSSQYEMVGGTRVSDRKTPRRTAAPMPEEVT
jgi:hypothetical protein